MFVAIIKVFIL